MPYNARYERHIRYLIEVACSTNTFVGITVGIRVLVPEEDALGHEVVHLGLTCIRMGGGMPTWCLVVMIVVVAQETVRRTIRVHTVVPQGIAVVVSMTVGMFTQVGKGTVGSQGHRTIRSRRWYLLGLLCASWVAALVTCWASSRSTSLLVAMNTATATTQHHRIVVVVVVMVVVVMMQMIRCGDMYRCGFHGNFVVVNVQRTGLL